MKLVESLKHAEVWQSPSVVMLVIANLVPLVGVIFLGWEVFPLMLLFWLENVMVGALNAVKMLLAGGPAPIQIAKVFMVPFFCVHYGMFTMVHGVFVFALFGKRQHMSSGLFPSFDLVWGTLEQQHLLLGVVVLVASHVFSFCWNYLYKGEFRNANMQRLMMQPYGRIVVLHIAIIGGGFLILALGSPTAALALLVLLKIFLDVAAHAREHSLARPKPLRETIVDNSES